MRIFHKLLIGLSLSIFGLSAEAATNYVLLGYDAQTNIDAALPGDTLVFQAGPYPGDLTFSKPVTVLRAATSSNLVQFQGVVRVQGTGALAFAQCEFENSLQISCSGATVSLSQSRCLSPMTSQGAILLLSQVSCSNTFDVNLGLGGGTNLQAYDSSFTLPVRIAAGKTLLKRCTIANTGRLVLSSNAALEALRLTNYATTVGDAAISSRISLVAVQSYFYDIGLGGYIVSLGYNNIIFTLRATNCSSVIVGNVIGSGASWDGNSGWVSHFENGTVKAFNNFIQGTARNTTVVGLYLDSASAELVNNTIAALVLNSGQAIGMYVLNAATPVTLRNCIVSSTGDNYYQTTRTAVYAVNSGVVASYCDFYAWASSTTLVGVGPVANCLSADPVISGTGFLNPASSCINAGPPEPIFNDRDGTRNDIGYTGGPMFNPANYTNNSPIAFYLAGTPQNVFKGVQTNIVVNIGASAGH